LTLLALNQTLVLGCLPERKARRRCGAPRYLMRVEQELRLRRYRNCEHDRTQKDGPSEKNLAHRLVHGIDYSQALVDTASQQLMATIRRSAHQHR
jgi:hypothetical protein